MIKCTKDELKASVEQFNAEIRQEVTGWENFGISDFNVIDYDKWFDAFDIKQKFNLIDIKDNTTSKRKLRTWFKKGKKYLRINKHGYLDNDWFNINIRPMQAELVSRLQNLIQNYQAHNFYVLPGTGNIRLIHYDNAFYFIDSDNIKNLHWDQLLLPWGFSIDDESLQMIKNNNLYIDQYYDANGWNIKMRFTKELTQHELDILQRMYNLITNFNRLEVNDDIRKILSDVLDWEISDTISFITTWSDNKIEENSRNAISINGFSFSVSKDYTSFIQWLDNLVKLDAKKKLTNDELMSYLKRSYKEPIETKATHHSGFKL